ncbi:unnamed protein product, partial [Ixodes pacificus]
SLPKSGRSVGKTKRDLTSLLQGHLHGVGNLLLLRHGGKVRQHAGRGHGLRVQGHGQGTLQQLFFRRAPCGMPVAMINPSETKLLSRVPNVNLESLFHPVCSANNTYL